MCAILDSRLQYCRDHIFIFEIFSSAYEAENTAYETKATYLMVAKFYEGLSGR